MGSNNTTSTGPPSTPDALNDADTMLAVPDSDFGVTAEVSDSAISAVDQTDAHSHEIEMIPVDGTEPSPPFVSVDGPNGMPPLAMPFPLASSSVAFSSVPGTPSASTPGSYRSNNRRPRVDDDDDDERDRRHPSQRISSSNSASGTPIPPSYPNTQPPSGFTASNFPMFTPFTFMGQPGAVNPADDAHAHAHLHPLGSFLGGLFSANGPSGSLHNNNSAPVALPNDGNGAAASPTPATGSSSRAGPNAPTPQSQSHSQQERQQQNGSNDPNRPSIQLFDYEFSIVVDRDGARPVQIHQRGGGQGRQQQQAPHPPNGPPLSPPTPASVPTETNGQQQTHPHPHPLQQQPPQHPRQQTPLDSQLPQMPQPTGAPVASGAGPIPNPPLPIPPNFAANLANLFTMPFGFVGAGGFTFGAPLEEKEDPERARKLIEGLEKVPVGLVRRLERVGKGTGGMGEEQGKGGDAGCAVCWERLLENEGDIRKEDDDEKMVVDTEGDEATTSSKEPQPTIVALPCAHVFHADCLIPWFSRPKHTTCPTCRFNIDPENLTYVSAGARRRQEERERRRREGAPEADADADANANEGDGAARDEAPAPVGAEGADEGGQAQAQNQQAQQQQDDFDFGAAGGGFAGLLQMLNAQTQMRGQAPTVPNMGVGGAAQPGDPTSQPQPVPLQPRPQPQGQGQYMPIPMLMPFMSVPVPAGPTSGTAPNPIPNVQPGSEGNTSTSNAAPNPNPGAVPGAGGPQPQFPGFLPGMGIGLGMQAFSVPLPGGVMIGGPMSMPWGIPGFGNANHGNANPGSAPPATTTDDVPAPSANTTNQPSSAQQGQPAHPPTGQNQGQGQRPLNFMADVLRVTVDMVFEGPPVRQGEQAAQRRQQHAPSDDRNGSEGPEGEGEDHGAEPQDFDDEDFDEEEEEGTPDMTDPLTNGRQLQELVDLIMRGGQGPAVGTETPNADAATGNEDGGANAGQESQPQSQPQQQEPSQPQVPPPPTQSAPGSGANQTMPIPTFQNMGGGIHVASGSGRSLGEAFAQMFSDFHQRMGAAPGQAEQADRQHQHQHDAQPQPQQQLGPAPGQNQEENQGQGRPQQQQQPRPWQFIPVPLPPNFGFPMRPARPQGAKRPWAPPPAPGPTLRQRIERREREAGLRCYDVSCGLGPSDEDPFAGELEQVGRKDSQLAIISKAEKDKDGRVSERKPVCEHLFHGSCLVSAERVKLRGAETVFGEDGCVEVSCPVCRVVGCITKEQWEEGVGALQ